MATNTPSWFEQNGEALLEAITLFVLLAVMLIGVTWYYDFTAVPIEQMRVLAFVFALCVCIMVAKNTFDLRRLANAAEVQMVGGGQADALLAKTNQTLFQQVYHNSPVPYVLIDQSGTIMSSNIAALRLFHRKQNELVGTDLFSYLEAPKAAHLQFMQQKFQSRIALTNEEVMVKGGEAESVSWTLLSLYPFTDAFDESMGLVTLVDITRQKQVENAKAEFVSLASHQLRTPIAGMRWSAELLLMDNPDVLSHRQKKYIERMLQSVDRMSVLVDDFLRVSRFELGTFVPEQATVSLPALIAEIQADQAAVIRKKELQFTVRADSALELMRTDPNLLRMIVTNLLSNAIKYTLPNGEVAVTAVKTGDTVAFEVRDSGMGIPVADQSQIFQKLYRASNATREVPDGTGLGLYIVREAVRVLGGRISFVSNEGVGTTFTVVLPFEKGD